MRNKVKLLDCTLRDGGSVNEWNFGYDNIIGILKSLNNANIDIVEIGFLQNGYTESYNLSIADNTGSFDEKLKEIEHRNFKAVTMIDLGKFDINKLPSKEETLIDGIRLMFKKQDMHSAIEMSEKIKNKGYDLSLNPVSVTTYNTAEIKWLCTESNYLNPDIVYIIDTYGLMDKVQTLEYFNMFNEYLDPQIEIGYHAHNNLQLAFSNSIEVINAADNRSIVTDGSLYGMGKRAGNTPTELLAYYLNENNGGKYNIITIDTVNEQIIKPFLNDFEWGYSLIHYIAAVNKCHSDYVSYLYKELGNDIQKINRILKTIPEENRLTFDKKIIETVGV